jgi:hypothetical protein
VAVLEHAHPGVRRRPEAAVGVGVKVGDVVARQAVLAGVGAPRLAVEARQARPPGAEPPHPLAVNEGRQHVVGVVAVGALAGGLGVVLAGVADHLVAPHPVLVRPQAVGVGVAGEAPVLQHAHAPFRAQVEGAVPVLGHGVDPVVHQPVGLGVGAPLRPVEVGQAAPGGHPVAVALHVGQGAVHERVAQLGHRVAGPGAVLADVHQAAAVGAHPQAAVRGVVQGGDVVGQQAGGGVVFRRHHVPLQVVAQQPGLGAHPHVVALKGQGVDAAVDLEIGPFRLHRGRGRGAGRRLGGGSGPGGGGRLALAGAARRRPQHRHRQQGRGETAQAVRIGTIFHRIRHACPYLQNNPFRDVRLGASDANES